MIRFLQILSTFLENKKLLIKIIVPFTFLCIFFSKMAGPLSDPLNWLSGDIYTNLSVIFISITGVLFSVLMINVFGLNKPKTK